MKKCRENCSTYMNMRCRNFICLGGKCMLACSLKFVHAPKRWINFRIYQTYSENSVLSLGYKIKYISWGFWCVTFYLQIWYITLDFWEFSIQFSVLHYHNDVNIVVIRFNQMKTFFIQFSILDTIEHDANTKIRNTRLLKCIANICDNHFANLSRTMRKPSEFLNY